jgi:hypothetical protein
MDAVIQFVCKIDAWYIPSEGYCGRTVITGPTKQLFAEIIFTSIKNWSFKTQLQIDSGFQMS